MTSLSCETVTQDVGTVPPSQVRLAVSALNGPIRLTTLAGAPERVLLTGVVNVPTWSPAGDRLVYVDDRGGGEYALSLTDTLGSSARLPVPLRSTWPQYSADGSWIYFFTQTNQPPQVYRIRPSGAGLELLMEGSFPTPAPDGARMAVVTGPGIWVGNVASRTGSVLPGTSSARVLSWSPDGQWIAHWASGNVVLIRPDASGFRTLGTAGGVGGLAWSPDARTLLAANGGTIKQFDLARGTEPTSP